MATIDFEGTIGLALATAKQVKALIMAAADPRTPLEERRTKAVIACEQIAATGLLARLEPAIKWFEANKRTFVRGLKGADLINDLLRGGR